MTDEDQGADPQPAQGLIIPYTAKSSAVEQMAIGYNPSQLGNKQNDNIWFFIRLVHMYYIDWAKPNFILSVFRFIDLTYSQQLACNNYKNNLLHMCETTFVFKNLF